MFRRFCVLSVDLIKFPRNHKQLKRGKMKFQIKSLGGELEEEKKKYLRKRIVWLEDHILESATLTIGVRQHITKKSNQAFEVIFHLIVQGSKRPLYVRTFGNSFNVAVDKAEGKIERIVVKKKEKGSKFRFKLPSMPKIPKLSLRRGK